jgi:hypothetical protein
MSLTDFCAVDAATLKSTLASISGESVDVLYTEMLDGFYVLALGDTPIPASTLLSKHKERAYTVPLSRLRDVCAALPDGTVTISDDAGVLVVGGVRVADDSDEDTKESPTVTDAPAKSAAGISFDLPKLAPTTATFRLLRAALALSAAHAGGAPYVERASGDYLIRLGALTIYRVDITPPLATVVTVHACVSERWVKLESWRMPKLAPAELLSLFVTGKEISP